MSDIAIRVDNLSKLYHIGAAQERHDTLRDQLVSSAGRLFRSRRSQDEPDTIWALKDISFEVRRGDVLGIIGRNGAGKSTLLKILSQITEPTGGRAVLDGRVGSLLEVGTGFHPELTGRENIYLNGAILGMGRREIEFKFDEIVDFAEIDKFLDTPVKRYSSGMYVRLAFAVAAHLEPEILLVDEVLAVGDASFQKKCLKKMNDVSIQGRTVLFVSHNMAAVQSICKTAIWINDGQIIKQDDTVEVVSKYLSQAVIDSRERTWDNMLNAPGNEHVRLQRVSVRPQSGHPNEPITIRTPIILEFEYWNLKPDTVINLSAHLFNEQGLMVLNTFPMYEPKWFKRPHPSGLFCSRCYIPGDLLNDGLHRVNLMVVKDQGIVLYTDEDTLVFNVQDSPERRPDWHGKWLGAVRPILDWETELLRPLPLG